jgi:light-harvesting complex 1 alpha chain
MHRIWLAFEPRRMMIALFGFLGLLAFIIHFILLGSQRYSWIENGTLSPAEAPIGGSSVSAAADMSPLPPGR